jgi:hypothetical protein
LRPFPSFPSRYSDELPPPKVMAPPQQRGGGGQPSVTSNMRQVLTCLTELVLTVPTCLTVLIISY